jgi:O-antigen/teichoic acid export membrane protein
MIEEKSEKLRNKAILLGGIASFLPRVVGFAFPILITPSLLRIFDTSEFNLWIFLLSTIQIFSVLDLGLSNTLVNRATGDRKGKSVVNLQIVISNIYFFSFFLSIFVMTLLILLQTIFKTETFYEFMLKKSTEGSKDNFLAAINLVFFSSLAVVPFSLVAKLRQGFQENYIQSMWEAVGKIISIVLYVIFFLLKTVNLTKLVICFVMVPNIFVILNFLSLFFWEKNYLFPQIRLFDFGLCKKLISEGSLFLTIQAIFALNSFSDGYILLNYATSDSISKFTLWKSLFDIIPVITMGFSVTLWPAVQESKRNNNFKWILFALKRACFSAITISAFYLMFLYLFHGYLFSYLFHGKIMFTFFDSGIFAIYALILALTNLSTNVMFGLEKFRIHIFALFISFIFGLMIKLSFQGGINYSEFATTNLASIFIFIFLPHVLFILKSTNEKKISD